MPVRLGGATSGYTELTASTSAGNNTITMPASNGAAYQVVRNGATPGELEFYTPSSGVQMTLATAVTVNAGPGYVTAIDFTSIPSWVKQITVMFKYANAAGVVQIGTSAGVVSTGYVSGAASTPSGTYTSETTGFRILGGAAGGIISGAIKLNLISGNSGVQSGTVCDHTNSKTHTSGGYLDLPGTLDRLRLSGYFYNGAVINIIYEG